MQSSGSASSSEASQGRFPPLRSASVTHDLEIGNYLSKRKTRIVNKVENAQPKQGMRTRHRARTLETQPSFVPGSIYAPKQVRTSTRQGRSHSESTTKPTAVRSEQDVLKRRLTIRRLILSAAREERVRRAASKAVSEGDSGDALTTRPRSKTLSELANELVTNRTSALQRTRSQTLQRHLLKEPVPRDDTPTFQEASDTNPAHVNQSYGLAMDILMELRATELENLREEFQSARVANSTDGSEGVDLVHFVRIMMLHLVGSNDSYSMRELAANLCELFAEIDVNGDGNLTWDEFMGYIIDSGRAFQEESTKVDVIQQYHPSKIVDEASHGKTIEMLKYFPSMHRLVMLDNSSKVRIVHPGDLKIVKEWVAHKGVVQNAEYIPEHNLLATCSADFTMHFWDYPKHALRRRISTPHAQMCMSWSPGNDTLFSGDTTGVVHAWNIRHAKPKVSLHGHKDMILDLLHIPNVGLLASAGIDGRICIWDNITGARRQLLQGHRKGIFSLAYAPTHHFLCSAGFDHSVFIWNPFVDKLVTKLDGHNNSLCGVAAVPDTPQLVSADRDGVVKIWDIRTFGCVQTYSLGKNVQGFTNATCLTTIPVDKRFVVGSNSIAMFDYETPPDPTLADEQPVCAAFYNDVSNTFIMAAGHDVKIWDAFTGRLSRVYRNVSCHDITGLCLDDRQRKFIIGDHSGMVKIFNYSNGAMMETYRASSQEIRQVRHLNRRAFIVSMTDRDVGLYNERTGHLRVLRGHDRDVTCMAYSSTLDSLATGSADCTVILWEMDRISQAKRLEHEAEVNCLRFLAGYPALVTADLRGTLYVWAMPPLPTKYCCLFRFEGFAGTTVHAPISSMAWCEEKQWLYSANDQGEVKMWSMKKVLSKANIKPFNVDKDGRLVLKPMDLTTRTAEQYELPQLEKSELFLITRWSAHSDIINSIQCINDPRTVLTCSDDGRVRLWSSTGRPVGSLLQGDDEALLKLVLNGENAGVPGLTQVSADHMSQLLAGGGVSPADALPVSSSGPAAAADAAAASGCVSSAGGAGNRTSSSTGSGDNSAVDSAAAAAGPDSAPLSGRHHRMPPLLATRATQMTITRIGSTVGMSRLLPGKEGGKPARNEAGLTRATGLADASAALAAAKSLVGGSGSVAPSLRLREWLFRVNVSQRKERDQALLRSVLAEIEAIGRQEELQEQRAEEAAQAKAQAEQMALSRRAQGLTNALSMPDLGKHSEGVSIGSSGRLRLKTTADTRIALQRLMIRSRGPRARPAVISRAQSYALMRRSISASLRASSPGGDEDRSNAGDDPVDHDGKEIEAAAAAAAATTSAAWCPNAHTESNRIQVLRRAG